MNAKPFTFDDLIAEMRRLEENAIPRLKSVWFHPDDYAELEKVARIACVYPSNGAGMALDCIGYDGVLLFKDDRVERGKPWYDPPEAAPRTTSPQPKEGT